MSYYPGIKVKTFLYLKSTMLSKCSKGLIWMRPIQLEHRWNVESKLAKNLKRVDRFYDISKAWLEV